MNQKQKNNANNQPQQVKVQAVPIESMRGEGATFSALVSVVTVITSTLLVLGYGYQRGLAEVFHLEVSSIADSASDFLIAAPDALAYVFTKLSNNFSSFINSLLDDMIYINIGFAILFPIVWYVVRKQRKQKKLAKTAAILKVAPWYTKTGVQYCIAALLGAGVAPITLVVIYGTILYMLALVFAFMLPFGYFPGKANAETYIINPDHCKSLPVKQPNTITPKTSAKPGKQSKEVFATCVAIVKDGNEIARGRLIAVHADRIFLFVKKTGQVKSIPINDVFLELVDKEEAPTE